MNHLVIYSHPNPASFNHAIKESVVKVLKQKGQSLRIRDLYALKFDPVLRATDFEAFLQGRTPRDIEIEQEHVRWAEMLIFVYPVWWAGMPAITRGYIDRVFSKGFAYDYDANGPKALLPGKKVCIFNTLGASISDYEKAELFKSIGNVTDKTTFEFCGCQVVQHKYFGSVPNVTDEERKAMLVEAEQIVASLPA